MDAYLQNALREMESATQGLNDSDLNALTLASGKWSAAQTLEHLILTFTSTTKLMRKIGERRTAVTAPTVKQRVAALMVTGLGHMPGGRKAPEFARPAETAVTDACQRLRDAIAQMDVAITNAERLRPTRQRIAVHAILGPLTARQWRKFHMVHAKHHMNQIRAMRQISRRAETSAA